MLSSLRENFKTRPYLKWMLLLVAASMVLYLADVFDLGSGRPTGNWAARVNGVEISTRDFLNTARQVDDYYRQVFGQNYDQIKPQLQIGAQAMQRIVDREVILLDARRIGLQASKREIADQIRALPTFQDATGQFIGTQRYADAVGQQIPGGVPAFEQNLADDLVVQKWSKLVTQPLAISDRELRDEFRRRTVKTSIDYVVVASAQQKVDREAPKADELQAWYDENRERYRRAEGRRIRLVTIDRDAVMESVEISAEEIRAYYEANEANYEHPEQRRASHILFRLPPGATDAAKAELKRKAETMLERARGGEDFAKLAVEFSDDTVSAGQGGDLDFFTRGTMVAAFDEAAFNTPVGEFAPVTETPFGFHVIQVTDARDAGLTPLDEVETTIRRSLQLRAAQDRVVTQAQRIRGEIAAADLAAVAEREGLEVTERLVTRGDRLTDLGAAPDFTPTILALDPGSVSEPLRLAAGMAVVVVDEIVPAAIAPLDEVRNQVSSDLLNHKARQSAVAAARDALQGGDTMAGVAKKLKLEVQSSGDLQAGRLPPGTGGSSPEALAALFGEDADVGERGVVPVPAGALAYEITAREGFDEQRFEAEKASIRNDLLQQMRASHQQAIVTRLRSTVVIEENTELRDRLSG